MNGTRVTILAALLAASAAQVFAQSSRAGKAAPSLDAVIWAGPGTSLEALRGKTVVVLSYVTWCPKCDAWAPDMLSQLKTAVADKPVVVLAISTQTPTVPGPVYMQRKNFVGANIVHGHDPTLNSRFGFNSLFNYAIVDPEGKVVKVSNAGQYDPKGDSKQFTISRDVEQLENPGEFTIITAEMSPELKQLLWPMEIGLPIPERQLARARKLLGPEKQQELEAAVTAFLDRQLATIKQQAEGEVPEQVEAYAAANELSTNFRATEQGRAAREIMTTLAKDKEFKRELSARAGYAKTLELIAKTPERREALLTGFAKRFDGTHYAKLALEAANKPPLDAAAGQDAVQATP